MNRQENALHQDPDIDGDDSGPPRRVRNIAELAALAGVSPGTVSRALAGKEMVNAVTRERIRLLAERHDFRPNQMARRLRTQRTGVVGIVVPLGHERRQHLSDPFFMTMLGYLADALTENGYDIMLSRMIPDAPDWLERIVDSGMLDGVLLIGQSDQFAAIERVAARYRPLVAWGSHLPEQKHCAIGVDNRLGGRLLGERLLARGARRLAFLGEIRTLELAERYAGLCEATAAANLTAPVQLDIHLATDLMEAEVDAHLGRLVDQVDAIAAASDVLAATTIRLLVARGIAIPDDIAVTGFDDLPIASQAMPRITTIRQDLAAGAQAMVAALFARMRGEPAPSVTMEPILVERASA